MLHKKAFKKAVLESDLFTAFLYNNQPPSFPVQSQSFSNLLLKLPCLYKSLRLRLPFGGTLLPTQMPSDENDSIYISFYSSEGEEDDYTFIGGESGIDTVIYGDDNEMGVIESVAMDDTALMNDTALMDNINSDLMHTVNNDLMDGEYVNTGSGETVIIVDNDNAINNNVTDNDIDLDSLSFGDLESSSESNHSNPLPSPVHFSDSSDSLEFPSSDQSDSIIIDPLIFQVMALCLQSPVKTPSIKQPVRRHRKEPDISVFLDPRYTYFLKKVCNLSKKDCIVYGKEQNRLLLARYIKNKCEILNQKKFYGLNEEQGLTVFFLEQNECDESRNSYTGMDSINLSRLPGINPITLPVYDRDTFEYAVYKHKDNLQAIARDTFLDIKDVILIYYLKYCNKTVEITGTLLDKYVDAEWTLRDRILFEENFEKYSTKFQKFIINKSEEDLRIYYRYYLKNYLPVNWTEEERGQFSYFITVYKKDWASMARHFERKNVMDLKVYYGSYYKKLDEEERAKELKLYKT